MLVFLDFEKVEAIKYLYFTYWYSKSEVKPTIIWIKIIIFLFEHLNYIQLYAEIQNQLNGKEHS